MDTPPKPQGSTSDAPKPIFQTETTGTVSGDVKEAVKRLSLDDFSRIGEIPCMRTSLMCGIASGVGVGVVRSMSLRTNRIVALHWGFGTFIAISLGAWTMCQKSIEAERRRVQMVVEAMPRRLAKEKAEAEAKAQAEAQQSK